MVPERTAITFRSERWRAVAAGVIETAATTFLLLIAVTWLPLYHDLGLIGGILQPLYAGIGSTILAPTAFLQRPIRWLQAVSRERATISGGPNFAYDLCVRKITPEQKATLDLSSWEIAANGAEPFSPGMVDETIDDPAWAGEFRDALAAGPIEDLDA